MADIILLSHYGIIIPRIIVGVWHFYSNWWKLLMLLMDLLSEVHVFIIRVKRKITLGRSDKRGKRQNNVFKNILAYTSLACRCKYPRQRDSCRKCNSQFFCKVSKASGTLIFGSILKHLLGEEKVKQIYQIRVSVQFKVFSS